MADDPEELEFEPLFRLRDQPRLAAPGEAQPDRRDGAVYKMPPELHLAVEVALVTGRPLLLRGDPGTGKSSLAAYVARRLNWRYYEFVTTSATLATDLQWRFDAVRRLSDAHGGGKAGNEQEYVDPGALWWAFHRESARELGNEPDAEINGKRDEHRAVVLIDEIDKAHPDVPNALLVALGSNQLKIPYLDAPVTIEADAAPPLKLSRDVQVSRVLVMVTTNEERELPRAFVRRCVTFRLKHPDAEQLAAIAGLHFAGEGEELSEDDAALALALGKRVWKLRNEAEPGQRKPSTAEFLDAFKACHGFVRVDPEDPRWRLIERVSMLKPELEEA